MRRKLARAPGAPRGVPRLRGLSAERAARSFALNPPPVLVRVLLALLVVLSACSAPPTGEAAALPGSSWTVERIVLEGGDLVRGDGEQRVTFGDDGSIAVSSCNDCTGRYRISGDALSLVAPLGCTRKACPTGTLELERYLAGVTRLSRDGDFLVLQPETSGTRILLARTDVGM